MEPYDQMGGVTLYCGEAAAVLRELPEGSARCCVTSPPYWGLRDYGVGGQLGLERAPDEYVARLVAIFREVRRVLKDDGTLWLNLGDSYAANRSYQVASTKGGPKHSPAQGALSASTVPDGLKPKDLVGIPWRVAFALQADGWYLRQDIIWAKPNPMPESVTDRCTKAHEYLFLLSKRERYYYDASAIAELSFGDKGAGTRNYRPGSDGNQRKDEWQSVVNLRAVRNRRSVWTVATQPYAGAHFATFPPKLIEPCILAGCPEGGVVLDPFMGSGTTAAVARNLARKAIGIDLNADYLQLARKRLAQGVLDFGAA